MPFSALREDVVDLRTLSLCTGIRGLDLGLHAAAGGRTRAVCYVEREAFPLAHLVEAMQEGRLAPAPIWSDVSTFDARPWRRVVDCIAGSYPCQPFSQAGRRQGANDARHLWPDFARIIRECEPWLCVFENVAGHASLGLDEVARDLEDMGYASAGILLRASDVGAPHQRERLFILAGRVADSLCERLALLCERDDDNRSHALGHEPDGRNPHVADVVGEPLWLEPKRDQRQGRGERTPERGHTEPLDDGFPGFPPFPEDEAGWAEYLERHPDLEPAFLRGVHGLSEGLDEDRVDRIRALGNAVVPQQAAVALRILACALYDSLYGAPTDV